MNILFSYRLSDRSFSCSIHTFFVLYFALSCYHVMMTMTDLQFSMICDISEYLIFFLFGFGLYIVRPHAANIYCAFYYSLYCMLFI